MLNAATIEKALLETMEKYKDFPITREVLQDIKKDVVATLTEMHPRNGKMTEEGVSRALTEMSGIDLN